jgi:energy-coupling factor transporter ATP-binding protein EcfA2
MENRLEFFRRQMAAFDGAADPRDAMQRGFYIEEPEHSVTHQLFKRISLKANSKNLLLGGIGSGKTTQLLKIEQLLRETDIYPHYVDVTKHINLSSYNLSESIQGNILSAIFGLELIELLKNLVHIDGSMQTLIRNYAYGSTEAIGYHHSSSIVAERIGVLSAPRTAENNVEISQALTYLLDLFRAHFSKDIFFLLDGLDRVLDTEKFIRFASSDIANNKIGFLLVGPVSLLYSHFIDRIDDYFNYFEYRPAFDVSQSQSAYAFFQAVIESRSEPSFFNEDALSSLIHLSGGVLRDLINLTQEAIQEAYLSDDDHVQKQHVTFAVRSLGRAKLMGLDDLDNQLLLRKETYYEPFPAPSNPREISLMASGRILEYRHPKRYFAVHPILRILLAHRGVKTPTIQS